MKILIAEDEFTSRALLQAFLSPYGQADVAVDGAEAIEAFRCAHAEGAPYDLICLDIMMPRMVGEQVLIEIRREEQQREISLLAGAKVVMITSLASPQAVLGAFREGCEAYVTKPIDKSKLLNEIAKLGLISNPA